MVMTEALLRGLHCSVALAFFLCTLGFAAAPTWAALGPAEWAQDKSDIAPDPAVRFGALANGMHFMLMRNATPAGHVAVRMRIGSGSRDETDQQQGLAHFLEHMAFKGSTHVPGDE